MEGFVKIVCEVCFEPEKHVDGIMGEDIGFEGAAEYIATSSIKRIITFPSQKCIGWCTHDVYIRQCIWRNFAMTVINGYPYCYDKHDSEPCHPWNKKDDRTCDCPIPDSYFPIIIAYTQDDKIYLIYPSAEEREKILGPSLLKQVLNELQYNPDAGSRVAEARESFEKRIKLE